MNASTQVCTLQEHDRDGWCLMWQGDQQFYKLSSDQSQADRLPACLRVGCPGWLTILEMNQAIHSKSTLAEISADILAIEKEAEGLLDGLLVQGARA